MAFKSLDPEGWKKALRRVLLVGPPNSRKTTGMGTWPGMKAYMVYPGETGHGSIDVTREDTKAFVWEEDAQKTLGPAALVKEIESNTWDILAGKHGAFDVFNGDGIHKLYAAYINDASAGAFGKGEEFDPKCYGHAHEMFAYYLNRVMASPMSYVNFSCWDGREADDPTMAKGTSHVYPDLPGKMAKRIMGMFSVVLYCEVSPPQAAMPGQKPTQTATWQLQPGGKVWGAGVKVPPEIAAKLPLKVEQNWQTLEPLLLGAGVKP